MDVYVAIRGLERRVIGCRMSVVEEARWELVFRTYAEYSVLTYAEYSVLTYVEHVYIVCREYTFSMQNMYVLYVQDIIMSASCRSSSSIHHVCKRDSRARTQHLQQMQHIAPTRTGQC